MFAKYCWQDYLKACQGLLQPAKYIICLLESVYDKKFQEQTYQLSKISSLRNRIRQIIKINLSYVTIEVKLIIDFNVLKTNWFS